MVGKPVELPNGRSWKTQTAAHAHFKAMLHRYDDEEEIDDRADFDDLLALLERYDGAITEWPSKIGVGVDTLFRRQNRGEAFSTPGFWVRRIDGQETDFSYIHAVRGVPKSQGQELYDACRAAVASDLIAAKKRHFTRYGDGHGRVPCDMTGNAISYEQAHLDHAYPTFGQLVIMFRAVREWQHAVPDGVLTKPQDAQATTSFVDASIGQSFRALHHSAAILRVIDKSINLSMAGQQRRPNIRYPVEV